MSVEIMVCEKCKRRVEKGTSPLCISCRMKQLDFLDAPQDSEEEALVPVKKRGRKPLKSDSFQP